MANLKPHEERHPTIESANAPSSSRGRFLPVPLWIAYGIVLAVGALLLGTRQYRLESSVYQALNASGASIGQEKNGLQDSYARVVFQAHNVEVAKYLSLCALEPKLALRLFRQALEKGNKSAKLMALHSAFYLAEAKQLTAEDIALIVGFLAPDQDAALRAVAQRALSELTLLTDAAGATRYETLPPDIPARIDDVPTKIATRAETLPDGAQVLMIRWSGPDLALAWWKTTGAAGSWEPSQQRYLVR